MIPNLPPLLMMDTEQAFVMAVSELNGGCHGSGPFVLLLDKRLKRGKEEAGLVFWGVRYSPDGRKS